MEVLYEYYISVFVIWCLSKSECDSSYRLPHLKITEVTSFTIWWCLANDREVV